MAYKVTRKNKIQETLELCRADGSVAHELEVSLNIDEMGGRINKAYEQLGLAQNNMGDDPTPEKAEDFGRAVVTLFEVIFGESGAKTIVEFYENRYVEMLMDLFSFINEVVLPAVREASFNRRQQMLSAVESVNKGNREYRRKLQKLGFKG